MSKKNEPKKYVVDEQTGVPYELKPEERTDLYLAWISILYLLGMMGFFFWLLFDIWIGQNSLANLIGYTQTASMKTVLFRLIAYAFIGGALGGIVDGIRSFLKWHSERAAFGARFVWRYITTPWLGSALALFTFALIRGGVAIFSGESSPDTTNLSQSLATFSVGVLAGYGSRNVFIWLDAQVARIFRVDQVEIVNVQIPELTGKTQQDAESILTSLKLKLGEVQTEVQTDPEQTNKIIRQDPLAGNMVAIGDKVNITIAVLE